MAKLEWYAALYIDEGRICIPSEVLEAALIGGAKKQKLGKQAQAGLFVADNLLLAFDGSDKTIDELWERDENRFTKAVRIGTSKVMRTRFIAKKWQAIAEVVFDPQLLNSAQVVDIVKTTGEIIAVGTWRPKFGRFASEMIK